MKNNTLIFVGLFILFTLAFVILILGITPISTMIELYQTDAITEMLLAPVAAILAGFFQTCLWYRIIEARFLKRKNNDNL